MYAARDYPAPFDSVEPRASNKIEDEPAHVHALKAKIRVSFRKSMEIQDPTMIQKQFELGEYVLREMQAMHSIRKYRHLNSKYGS